jgi:hypothetical protein
MEAFHNRPIVTQTPNSRGLPTETVRVLNAIQLLFDRLPQRRIVNQAENK